MNRTNMNYSAAALLTLLSWPRSAGKAGRFLRGIRAPRPRARLIRIERITAGGNHAWCESNVGLIRKPLSSVPADLRAEFGV